MCINGKTYKLFQVMGVEVAEVAVDLVVDVVEKREKEGPMANVAVPNLLIGIN